MIVIIPGMYTAIDLRHKFSSLSQQMLPFLLTYATLTAKH